MVKRSNQTMRSVVAIVSLALSVQLCMCSNATISDASVIKNEVNDDADMEPKSSSASGKQKPMYTTGNELWDGLIRDCLRKPSFSCIQKNVYTFLDASLRLNDVNVTSRFQLTRNQLEYEIPTAPNDEENEIFFEGRAAPIEEVSNALYDKGVKFLVTHNMDVKLPEVMFDGATFRISPRSIEGNGIIAKLEYIPKTEDMIAESRATPSNLARIFKKKIKKFFKKKVVMGVLAVVLIIKLIKIKIFWLLPLLVGVGKAKTLVLKFVLFLFPALSHIFKLCGYYHASHHKTNYHHHKHNINHLHTVLHDGHSGPEEHYVKEYIHTAPPKGNNVPPHLSYHSDDDWTNSGPGLGSEFISGIIDRKSSLSFKPKLKDAQDIVQWGLGHPYHGATKAGNSPNAIPPTSHSNNVNPLTHKNNKNRPQIIVRPVQSFGTPHAPNLVSYQPQNAQPLVSYGTPHAPPIRNYVTPHNTYGSPPAPPQNTYGIPSAPQNTYGIPSAPQNTYGIPSEPSNQYGVPDFGFPEQRISQSASQHHLQVVSPPANDNLIKAQYHEAQRIQKEQHLIAKQQSILNSLPFVSDVEPLTPKPIDPFYSPILTKLDQIFHQLGYSDEPCRERLVCNMYRNPTNYSPHSNYVSAELSRETSELQRPLKTNAAVMRFYKYVNAARDGQEQNDCAATYPCNLPTKK